MTFAPNIDELSTSQIPALTTLKAMGLLQANEAIYNQLTLGVTVTKFINGKKPLPVG